MVNECFTKYVIFLKNKKKLMLFNFLILMHGVLFTTSASYLRASPYTNLFL